MESLPAYGNKFLGKYLDVFSKVHVLGENIKGYLDNGTTSGYMNQGITIGWRP